MAAANARHILVSSEAECLRLKAEIEAIKANPEAPNFENTIVALEKSGRMLGRVEEGFGATLSIGDHIFIAGLGLVKLACARSNEELGLLAPEKSRLIQQAATNSLDQQLDAERDCQQQAGRSADYAEGVTAFLEKRPARFSGR